MIHSMKTARHLFALFPLGAAIATAQTPPAGTVAQVATTAATVTTGTTGTVVATATVVPVTPAIIAVPLDPAIIRPVGLAEIPLPTGETSVGLDVGFGIRAVLPS